MDNIIETEQSIYAAVGGSPEITDEHHRAHRPAIYSMIRSIDGLNWCIKNFPSMQYQSSQIFALSLMSSWCQDRYDVIPLETAESIRVLLFETLHINSTNDDAVHHAYRNAQVQLSLAAYPDPWPGIWQYVFQLPEADCASFLDCYCTEFSRLSVKRLPYFPLIRQSLIDNGILNQIVSSTQKLVSKQLPIGFSILVNLSKFSDSSVVLSSFDTDLQSALSNSSLSPLAIEVIRILISKITEEGTRQQLIDTWADPHELFQLCSANSDNEALHVAIAKLLTTAGLVAINSELSNDYFQLSLNIILLSDPVAAQIIPFIQTYSLVHQESYKAIIPIIIQRLAHFFAQESTTISSFLANLEFLQSLVATAATGFISCHENPQDILQESSEHLNIADDPATSSAFLYLVAEVSCLKPSYIKHPEFFIDLYEFILHYDPPLTQMQLVQLDIFCLLINSQPDKVNSETKSQIFSTIASILASKSLDSDTQKSLAKVFASITQSLKSSIGMSIEPIAYFISSSELGYSTIAANLISNLDGDSKQQAVEYCLNTLRANYENAQASGNQSVVNGSIRSAFSFLRYTNAAADDHFIGSLRDCLVFFSKKPLGNDEMIAEMIYAAMNILGVEALGFIQPFMSEIRESLSISALFSEIHRVFMLQQNIIDTTAFNELFSTLAPIIFDQIEASESVDFGPTFQSNACMALNRFRGAFSEFTKVFSQELVESIMTFCKGQMERRCDNMQIYDEVLRLVVALMDICPAETISIFTPLSLGCVFADSFNAHSFNWKKILKQLKCLQNKFSKKDPDAFFSLFETTLESMGSSHQMATKYFQYDEFDSRKQQEEQRMFFQAILINIHAIGF